MLTDVQALVYSAFLTGAMLVVASLMRARAWTPAGMIIAFGNRDVAPELSPVTARTDRAAKNTLEGLLLFVAVVAAARFAGAPADRLSLGATLFFWARVVYFGVYIAGIPYLRTVVWGVAVAGIVMIGLAAL